MQSPIDISALLKTALAEDIGAGDITSIATIPASKQAQFAMRARQELVVCGLAFLPELFALVDPEIHVKLHAGEGDVVAAGATLATLEGRARGLLAGERTALNLVQQLSGVATLTRAYVDAVAGTGAQILDTRKTVLGLRAAQKYAVRCGGGVNHRMGLYDAILIKDNHIAVAGGVAAAVKAARTYVKDIDTSGAAGGIPSPLRGGLGRGATNEADTHRTPSPNPLPQGERASPAAPLEPYFTLEVECDTLAQLAEALAAGVDSVLLDNMSNDQLREAVAKVRAHNVRTGQAVKTEASGNVSLATVRTIAETGVDYISVGKLTHSAVAVDVGLDEATPT
jgi:nicotinate-nucleotide pyrophosphorylase (carboxylating)